MLRASDPWPADYLQAEQNRDGHTVVEVYFMHLSSRPRGAGLFFFSERTIPEPHPAEEWVRTVAFTEHPDRLRASQETVTRAVSGCSGRVPCFESELLIFVSQ